MTEIRDFEKAEDAFDHAKHYARYGHKTWVLWKRADGVTRTAVATADSLKAALDEGVPIFSRQAIAVAISGHHGTCWNQQRPLLQTWYDNKIAGHC